VGKIERQELLAAKADQDVVRVVVTAPALGITAAVVVGHLNEIESSKEVAVVIEALYRNAGRVGLSESTPPSVDASNEEINAYAARVGAEITRYVRFNIR
jgi:hypothetical protein